MHLLSGGRSGLNNFLLLFEVDLTFRVFNKTPRAFILSVEKKKNNLKYHTEGENRARESTDDALYVAVRRAFSKFARRTIITLMYVSLFSTNLSV